MNTNAYLASLRCTSIAHPIGSPIYYTSERSNSSLERDEVLSTREIMRIMKNHHDGRRMNNACFMKSERGHSQS